MAFHKGCAQEHTGVLHQLVAVADKVIVAFELNQLVSLFDDAVDVEIVALRTVQQDHLAVGIEFVAAGQHGITIGVGVIFHKLLGQEDAGVLHQLVVVTDEVVIAFKLNKLISLLPDTILIEVVFIRTCQESCNTVFTTRIIHSLCCTKEMNNTDLHVALSIEQIDLAVDLIRSGGGGVVGLVSVIAGAIPAADTGSGSFPNVISHAALVEHELDVAIGSLLAVHACEGGLVEVVPILIDLDPAAEQPAGNSIVGLLIDDHQAGCVRSLAASADQLTINDFESMAGGGNGGAPVNDGSTNITIGSAGVASLGTGSRPVFHSLGGMDVASAALCLVSGIHNGNGRVHLGIHAELLVGEDTQNVGIIVSHIGDLTHVHVDLQVLGPELEGIPVGLSGIALHLDVSIKVEDADGQGCQHSLAGLLVGTGAGDGDGSGIVLSIEGIAAGEACSQLHVIQLPVVNTVQVDHSGNGLNGLNIGSLQIHPVHRTAVQTIQGSILGNQLDSGSVHTGSHIDQTDHHGLVAHVVGDLELDTVDTVSHSHIIDGNLAVSKGHRHLNTVHISLGRSCVQAGSIGLGGVLSHGSGNVQQIGSGGNSIVLLQLDQIIIRHHVHSAEDGSLTVIHSIREVSSDVINVDGVRSVDGTVGLPQVVGVGVGEHELDETEVVSIVLGSIVSKIGLVAGTGDQNLFILAHIHGEVTPAILIDGVVDLGLVNDVNSVLLIKYTVIVGIIPVHNTNPAVLILVGNVCPEADGLGILDNDGLIHEQIQLCIAAGRNIDSREGIGVQTHGAVAVMYLTVSSGSKAQLMDEAGIVAVDIRVTPMGHSLGRFEVKQDLGTLAQAQGSGGNQSGVMNQRSSHGASQVCRSILLRNRSELEAVEGTQGLVGGSNHYVLRLQDHLVQAAVDGCQQADGDFLIEGNGHDTLYEAQSLRNHDLNGSLADHCIVPDQLSGDGANFAVGNKHTVLDGAHAGICQLPDGIGGDLSLSTDQVSTQRSEGHSAAGGVVNSISGDVCAGKLTVCGGSRDNQNAVGGGTLGAVGGRAVDLQILTGTLGQESRGTAAVTVNSLHAAQTQHELSHFIAVKTGGEGSLTTVIHDDDDAAVSLDAHEGAGSGIRGMVLAVLIHTVLDQEAKVGRNDLLFPAGDRILGGADLGLGHISRAGNAILLIKVDDQTGLCAAGLVLAVLIQLTVQNQVAQGLTHQFRMLHIVGTVVPAQSNVHGSDNVAVAIGLGIGSLLRHNLNLVILIFQTLSHLVSAGDHLGIRIVNVDFHDVGHLTVGTCVVVQDDLGLGDAGSQNIVVLTDYVVVIIFAGGVDDLRGTEIACIRCDCGTVSFGCKGIHGQQTHDHHNCQKHGQEPSLRGVTHVVFPPSRSFFYN